MKPNTIECSRRWIATTLTLLWLSASSAFPIESPKPTPRPGTLGAYAQNVTLDRSALKDETGRVILTNDNVSGIGDGAAITLGSVVTAGRGPSKASSGGSSAERARWQAAHRKQRRVIAGLEKKKSLLETEIDHIEDQSLTPKTLARLDRAESKLRHLEREISQERVTLARIVRDARRQGAEPEWFR
jgi:hypothetical protein